MKRLPFLRRTESMHWNARLVLPWTVCRRLVENGVEDRHGQQHLDNQRR